MSPESVNRLNELSEAERSGLRKAIIRYGKLPFKRTRDFAKKVMARKNGRASAGLAARPADLSIPGTDARAALGKHLPIPAEALCPRAEVDGQADQRTLRTAEFKTPPNGPYRGLLYAHLRQAHDHLYYGPWRGLSASVLDLQRAHHQLGEYLEALEREVSEAGSADAKSYLEKAQNAYLRVDPGAFPNAATLNLDNTLAYAHRSLNYLLRSEGAPNHDPQAFEALYDVSLVPFREEI